MYQMQCILVNTMLKVFQLELRVNNLWYIWIYLHSASKSVHIEQQTVFVRSWHASSQLVRIHLLYTVYCLLFTVYCILFTVKCLL